jgi:hypothetical protein
MYPFAHKKHNGTLLFGNTLLKHGRHFYYWNQSLNIRMRACYLDCYETGLCYYLVVYIENILRPLQLFYSIYDVFTDSPAYISDFSNVCIGMYFT